MKTLTISVWRVDRGQDSAKTCTYKLVTLLFFLVGVQARDVGAGLCAHGD